MLNINNVLVTLYIKRKETICCYSTKVNSAIAPSVLTGLSRSILPRKYQIIFVCKENLGSPRVFSHILDKWGKKFRTSMFFYIDHKNVPYHFNRFRFITDFVLNYKNCGDVMVTSLNGVPVVDG